MKPTLALIILLLSCSAIFAGMNTGLQPFPADVSFISIEINGDDTIVKIATTDTVPKPALAATAENQAKELKKKKILAGFLAFPFPLGFLGAHRIMMGTKPWVPIAYVATFGGCFGLLPLVDFCVLMCSDNIEQYENNPGIFMWIK